MARRVRPVEPEVDNVFILIQIRPPPAKAARGPAEATSATDENRRSGWLFALWRLAMATTRADATAK